MPVVAVMEQIRGGRLAAEALPGPELWLDYFLVLTKEMPFSVASQQLLRMLKEELELISSEWANRSNPPATASPRKLRE